MKHSRRLLLLPLLLLVPLGALKWRADHPPLSEMDKTLRAALGTATSVQINFDNGAWREITGSGDRDNAVLHVKDKQRMGELIATLRCTDQAAPASLNSERASSLFIWFSWPPSQQQWQTQRPVKQQSVKWNALEYVWTPQGKFLQLHSVSPTGRTERVSEFMRMNSHFAARFESLLRDLTQCAQPLGMCAGVTLDMTEF